jgi:lactoylglutathione lyase
MRAIRAPTYPTSIWRLGGRTSSESGATGSGGNSHCPSTIITAYVATRHNDRVTRKPRFLGINHVALEVGDLDAALEWYGRIFDFELRGRITGMAFLDMGDQFIALSQGRDQPPDDSRHFGLVVDDKEATRSALEQAGAEIIPGRGLDFRDPWGNHVQVVEYSQIQFSKTPAVLDGMGAGGLEKTEEARRELREMGLG